MDGLAVRPRPVVRSARPAVALVFLALLVLAGCSPSRPTASRPTGSSNPHPAAGDDAVVVASFNFDESRLLGEIYAQALERAGVPVRRELDLGPREQVQPALLQGLVDVVPEYAGSALTSIDSTATVTSDTAAAVADLASRLAPWHLRPLAPAAAQNRNGFAVTRETAERLGVRTLSDLAAVAPNLGITGPAECPARRYCVAGLRDVYGIRFGRFDPYDAERDRLTALQEGVDDVAVVFTTDPSLAGPELVLLDDDRSLQPADNIVPVVSDRVVSRYGNRLTATLDAVSAQLSSADLTFLNWRVAVAGNPVVDEASSWLERHHIGSS